MRMPDAWVEGEWDGYEPVYPKTAEQFIWVAIFYSWRLDEPTIFPLPTTHIRSTLASTALTLKAYDERKGNVIRPPPKWWWCVLPEPVLLSES